MINSSCYNVSLELYVVRVALSLRNITIKSIFVFLYLYTGMTALHLACKGGHLDSVTRLVQAGTALDVKDNNGKTVLHHSGK